MNIYVSGSWQYREYAAFCIQEAIAHGFNITHDWTGVSSDKSTPEQLADCASLDIAGVQAADCLVVIAEQKFLKQSYRGTCGELGAALALGKPVFLVGHAIDSCIFVNHPLVSRVENVDEAFRRIKTCLLK